MTPTFYPGDRVSFVHPDAPSGTATVILVFGDDYIVQLDNGLIMPAFWRGEDLRLVESGGPRARDYWRYAVYILENLYRVRETLSLASFEGWRGSESGAEDADEYGEE